MAEELKECRHRRECDCPPQRLDTMLINTPHGPEAAPHRAVGPHSEPVAYTPPKYGPPPGANPVKWRAMSRVHRREHLRGLARTMNHVAHVNRETCQHGQLVGQCTECQKSTGR